MIIELIKDFYNGFCAMVKSSLRTYAKLLNGFLPYIMYLIGQYVFKERGRLTLGGELFIPIIIFILIWFINSYANKIGKGSTVPVPQKRFTEISDDEVTVEHERVQEMILYVADVEDYLERKGLL
jgi:hypothetical protein